jgi:DNA processing protein
LSKGIVVVEAGRKSGALITADQALEQGRTVLAMPGRIDSPASAGTHALIQQGAKLVTSAEDVLQEFEFLTGWSGIGQERQAARPAPSLSDKEARIMAELEQGEQNVDAVIRATGLGPGEVSALLIGLEMKRLIRMLPGRRIEAVG